MKTMPLKNEWIIEIHKNLAQNPASGAPAGGGAVSLPDREELRRRYRQWQAPGARFAALARAALARQARRNVTGQEEDREPARRPGAARPQ